MATANDVLDKLLDPVSQCLTPQVARQLVDLRASPEVQARIEQLAAKSTEGQLTDEERAEYQAYVSAGNFIATLQSKARSLLKKTAAPT